MGEKHICDEDCMHAERGYSRWERIKQNFCFHGRSNYYLHFKSKYYSDIETYKCRKCGARRAFDNQTKALLKQMFDV